MSKKEQVNNKQITTKKPVKKKTKAVKPKQKIGRKTKYDTHVLPKFRLIEAWCRDGAIDEAIYKKLQISKDSFYEYKKKYPEFSDLLKTSKEDTDVQVENSLLKRALGYMAEDIKEEYQDGILVSKTVTKKHISPDTTAQIFWLINRSAGKWQNTQRKEIQVAPETNKMLKSITNQIEKETIQSTNDDIDDLES